MYTPTKWEPAQEKEKFEAQFKKFIMGGFQLKDFPKWFYVRLSNTFGMIAHYNQYGFFDTYFTSSKGKVEFMAEVLKYPCYGDPEYTYSDVEESIQAWLREYLTTVNLHKLVA